MCISNSFGSRAAALVFGQRCTGVAAGGAGAAGRADAAKTGFSESRSTFSELSSVVMPFPISLEEHLQDLNNGKHPTITVKTVRLQTVRPRLATSVRLIWAAGRRSQHLLRSAGKTNIPARGEAGRS